MLIIAVSLVSRPSCIFYRGRSGLVVRCPAVKVVGPRPSFSPSDRALLHRTTSPLTPRNGVGAPAFLLSPLPGPQPPTQLSSWLVYNPPCRAAQPWRKFYPRALQMVAVMQKQGRILSTPPAGESLHRKTGLRTTLEGLKERQARKVNMRMGILPPIV
ncbi:hypothetical protein KIL84_017208 [Mauremys mutica]|uniref:Uncharacterized protein n=1 Tax=Mauremys mutica TaxID=74926 RepID=A0A9D4AX77_9SAUR|nr:hypothetical protein KIL84_017208 [Mauremys mutica]